MDTSGNNWNGHGLLVVPKCADPQWVQTHGTPTLDIVAVHGLNGGRWSTWSKEDVMWLNNLLPAKLPTARIMTFGYNADLVINFSALGIRDHARKLLSLLRDERYDTVTASRPIVFICHSLGGIIVKQALRFATNEAPYRELATAACGLVSMLEEEGRLAAVP
ncbi:hypothetical protein BGZ63DRAFT_80114 [Mariannaea sp. PMI_226]|nr:hypothetical protein BGZ63DRAFT_80114 [Mariannaea sp. PMI_226]